MTYGPSRALAFADDLLIPLFAGINNRQATENDGKGLVWAHDELGSFLAGRWLAEQGDLSHIQERGRLATWSDAIILSAKKSPKVADQLVMALLDNGGALAVDIACRIAGECSLPEKTLGQLMQRAFPKLDHGFERDYDTEEYLDRVRAVAFKHGAALCQLFVGRRGIEELEIIAEYHPREAVTALRTVVENCGSGYLYSAVEALAAFGQSYPDEVLPALEKVWQQRPLFLGLAIGLLKPTPSVIDRGFALLGSSADLDQLLVNASSTAQIGAMYPEAIPVELVQALRDGLWKYEWNNSDYGPPTRPMANQILAGIVATYQEEPAFADTLAQLFVTWRGDLPDFLPKTFLGNDQDGVTKGRLSEWYALSHAWPRLQTLNDRQFDYRDVELGNVADRWPDLNLRGLSEEKARELACEILGEDIRDCSLPLTEWRAWLCRALVAALSFWGGIKPLSAKPPTLTEKTPDENLFAPLHESVTVFRGRKVLLEELSVLAAKDEDDLKDAIDAYEALNEFAKQSPWHCVDLLVTVGKVGNRRIGYDWFWPLESSLKLVTADATPERLSYQVIPKLRELARDPHQRVRRIVGWAVENTGKAFPDEALELLSILATDSDPDVRDHAKYAKLELLKRHWKAIPADGDLRLLQNLGRLGQRFSYTAVALPRWTMFQARLLALALWPGRFLYKPKVRRFSTPVAFLVRCLILLPQAILYFAWFLPWWLIYGVLMLFMKVVFGLIFGVATVVGRIWSMAKAGVRAAVPKSGARPPRL